MLEHTSMHSFILGMHLGLQLAQEGFSLSPWFYEAGQVGHGPVKGSLPPPLTPPSGEGQARMDREEPRTMSVSKCWARSWNVLESCWPLSPQVRVAEVSGGERAAGSEKTSSLLLALL